MAHFMNNSPQSQTHEQTAIIRYIGVQKAFGTKVIYDDFNLDIYAGETLTLLGGSGTGKSVSI